MLNVNYSDNMIVYINHPAEVIYRAEGKGRDHRMSPPGRDILC